MKVKIKDLATNGHWSFEGTPKQVWRKAYSLARRWVRCGFAEGLNVGEFGYRLSVMVWRGNGWGMKPLLVRPLRFVART